mmetsp:Transcript_20962/g.23329  ORF Transcript_20962/g.23329 Transcript_20962/m.23329 type:complete len:95 (+) Transcript_20962:375-659(+)
MYNKYGAENLLKEYCEETDISLVDDPFMSVLRPKYPESKVRLRYKEGFLDIAQQQFLNDPSFKSGDTKIVMMFSHSDGYKTFLKLFSSEKFKSP